MKNVYDSCLPNCLNCFKCTKTLKHSSIKHQLPGDGGQGDEGDPQVPLRVARLHLQALREADDQRPGGRAS